jgi:L-threonylcarbamoyladenylate synthase
MKRQGISPCRRIGADQVDCSSEAAKVIGAGGLAAIPTETSYGLAVDPWNCAALERLFVLKRRPPGKAVLVLVDSMATLPRLISHIPALYEPLIAAFWPGPLTLIFPARQALPNLLTAGSQTIGIRISSNRLATRICRASGGAITATSANLSSDEPARTADEIVNIFQDRIDLVVDGGKLDKSRCSTVVRIEDGKLKIIREGEISAAALTRF